MLLLASTCYNNINKVQNLSDYNLTFASLSQKSHREQALIDCNLTRVCLVARKRSFAILFFKTLCIIWSGREETTNGKYDWEQNRVRRQDESRCEFQRFGVPNILIEVLGLNSVKIYRKIRNSINFSLIMNYLQSSLLLMGESVFDPLICIHLSWLLTNTAPWHIQWERKKLQCSKEWSKYPWLECLKFWSNHP